MKAAKLALLNSTRAVQSVLSYVQFISMGAMASNIARLPAAEKMADRSKPAQALVNKMREARSTYWAVTQQLGDAFNMIHDLESDCDKAVITRPIAIDPVQMQQLADASGMTVAEVTGKRQAVVAKAMAGEEERSRHLQNFITEGEWDTSIEFEEIEVDAEKVHAKICEVAAWICTWQKPDYAELMLLKHDRITSEAWALQESASKEGSGGIDPEPEGYASSEERKGLLARIKAADTEH